MGLIDILIWLALLFFVVKGYLKGLLREVCSLLSLVVGGWAAFHYYPYLAAAIRQLIHLPPRVTAVLAFVAVFAVLGLLFYLLGHLLTHLSKVMLLAGSTGWRGAARLPGGGLHPLHTPLPRHTRPVPDRLKSHLSGSRTARPFIETGREIVSGWKELLARNGVPAGPGSHSDTAPGTCSGRQVGRT